MAETVGGIRLQRHERTLVTLLEALRGHEVTVETVLGGVHTGTILKVESTMALFLGAVTSRWETSLPPPSGRDADDAPLDVRNEETREEHVDELYLSGKYIRYIHLPANIDVRHQLESRMRQREAIALSGRRTVWMPGYM